MRDTEYLEALKYLREKALLSRKTAELFPPLREAGIFEYILRNVPIGRIDNEPLAGDYGMIFADPEFKKKAVELNQEQKEDSSPSVTSCSILATDYNCKTRVTPAHTTVDYESVLNKGLSGIIRELKGARVKDRVYLEAEIASLEALLAWAQRFADDLGFEVCRSVPMNPAGNFHESIQSLWLVHTAIGIAENSFASLSLGRPDQYLWPFYEADIRKGVPLEELEKTMEALFLKLNRYGDPACAVNLGGVDDKGNDLWNDLTRMILRVAKRLQLPSPILAARIHPEIGQQDFDSLTVPELFLNGQPTFYGEFACRDALLNRGVPRKRVSSWAVNSCMGLIMPGREFSDMWAVVINFLLPLELALNNGKPFHGKFPFKLKTVSPSNISDIEILKKTTLDYASEIATLLIKKHTENTIEKGRERPDPYLSALLNGGIQGRDCLLGGAEYHTANVDVFALVNAADALTAVEHEVFRNKSLNLTGLVKIIKNNFKGHEPLRKKMLSSPKYGNDDPEADLMVRELADSFANIVRTLSNGRIIYMPSFHTLNAHIGAGKKWGASADGRLAGEPFAKNIGPMQGRETRGLTSTLNSAAVVAQDFYYGGQALDLHLEPGIVENPADARKFQKALLTYFDMGGLQVQVNALSADALRKAFENPKAYNELTVRVGGYSARFNSLNKETQLEMIKRFERKL